MTHLEAAALVSDGRGESRRGAETSDLGQWTVENLDAFVVEDRTAAQGMNISAWVASTVVKAADSQLGGGSSINSALLSDLSEFVSHIERIRYEDRELIERIEQEASRLLTRLLK
ncbi:hypothetical protein [Mesorhizobium sp. KR2-14]|uniref:hypothetical protein n=1 Tax=Mesorhizobium sp. KR2-14 TaxID=3156610 RepID=UPI0032B4D790